MRENNKFRKLKLLIAIGIICMGLSVFIPETAYAKTNHTQKEAVYWAMEKGNAGWCQDVDNAYGCQCVDLILAYYDYLVGFRASGNACDYRSNSLPAGWTRVYSNPKAGDIVVWGPGAKMGWSPLIACNADSKYGHIGIVWNINASGTISTIETNAGGKANAGYYERYTNNVACYIRPDFKADHTHSYSSSVTKQPTCTQTGVKSYKCSCGAAYTESIAVTGHKYVNETVDPTLTEQGYTVHTCSVCGDKYTDSYVEPPKKEADGWHYAASVPGWVSADRYQIQYQNYYEKIQQSAPGDGWTNAGAVKTEYKNSGSTYSSATDLQTSETRVLVHSVYYHFCGPNAGDEGNYSQTGNFVHYDEIPASDVTSKYLGTDNGYPYYFIYSKNGGEPLWCKSGVSCNGSYGTHGNRSRAWYKTNIYQNRVKVVQYKFTKTSDWTDIRDASATSVKIRFQELDPAETGTNNSGEEGTGSDDPGTGGVVSDEPGTNGSETPNPGIGGSASDEPETGNSGANGSTSTETESGKPGTGGSAPNKTEAGNPVQNTGDKENTVKTGNGSVTNNSGNTISVPTNPRATSFQGKPTARSRAFLVRWKKQSGITGYQIQYSTNKKFNKTAAKTKTVRNPGTTKLTVKKLKAKKKYYVRIRTYKKVNGKNYYSAWSKSKTVRTKR